MRSDNGATAPSPWDADTRVSPPIVPDPFVYSGGELETLAVARNYYRWLVGLLAPHLGDHVLEIGAGVGTLAAAVLVARPKVSLTLAEPASNNLPILQRRFADDARVRILPGFYAGAAPTAQPMDSVLLINVLEHVDDTRALLRSAREALRPGGRIVLLVPAGGALLYGTLDRAFSHHRRFTSSTLRAALEESGFIVRDVRHLNSLGVVPWFLLGRVFRRRRLADLAVRAYDVLAIPWLSRLEGRWTPPFGQSLLMVAEPRP
ncbi:MAG: class I SAM-dependent methyltransferase [bacterium]